MYEESFLSNETHIPNPSPEAQLREYKKAEMQRCQVDHPNSPPVGNGANPQTQLPGLLGVVQSQTVIGLGYRLKDIIHLCDI